MSEDTIWGLIIGFGVLAVTGVIALVKFMTSTMGQLKTAGKERSLLFKKCDDLAKSEESDVQQLRAEINALHTLICNNKDEIKDEIHKGNIQLMKALSELKTDLLIHKAETTKKK